MKKILTILFIFACTLNLYGGTGDKRVKISGKINATAPKYITPKSIEKDFETQNFELYNPWEKKRESYHGVLLDQLAKKYGTEDVKELKFVAIDDYNVDFKKELYEKERILLVYKVNGEYLSIRKKGPMKIVFVDYDASKKRYELNLPKWLWMIKYIEFK